MAKKQNLIKPTTLKPIRHNVGIENKYSKELRAFNKLINNSCKWWLLAKMKQYQDGGITNISRALEKEFNRLLIFWDKKANVWGEKLSKRISKDIIRYVNKGFEAQGFKISSIPRDVNQSIQSIINNNISLIKSIPSEVISKYQSVLYNNINSFDLEAIEKQVKNIYNVSNKRAKLIARDQVGKALENYSSVRSQSLGFEYYVWTTSRDERVSTGKGGHRQLDNRIYRYDTPTAIIDSYGNKGHTSQRVRCRCVAVPLILNQNERVKLIKDNLNGDYYIIERK